MSASKVVFLALYGLAVFFSKRTGLSQRLGILGQLVCLYYLVLFVWEIAFVSALK
jgi:hypothetical protein